MPSDLNPMQQETLSRVRGHLEGYADALDLNYSLETAAKFVARKGEFAEYLRQDAKALEELTGQEES